MEEFIIEKCFFGAATVGDRGQVVIPAEARKKLGISPGDKLLVLTHPTGMGIFLCKIDKIRDLFELLVKELERIESDLGRAGNSDGEAC
ncbi:MAG: AbrB/MazE/SpoVT family DNA-binding domain-containing protein [Armatimonadota bacterium]